MASSSDHYQELANLEMDGGYPTADTTRTLDEELYFQRAVQVYLWALPAINMYAMKKGLGELSGYGHDVMSVTEKRLKPNTLITTPNSDVIYGLTFADLSKTGPLVIDAPPMLQALIDDFWHRPLTGPEIDGVQYLGDIGLPGPDKGAGGKYLIVPEGYEGEIDSDEYFVFTCRTNGVFIFVRGFFSSVDDLSPGVKAVEGIGIHPLGQEPAPITFNPISDTPANALFPADGGYFDMLDEFIQSERIDRDDAYMHGVLAALGIRKGHTFAPTDRQKELLDLAGRTGWKMAKNVAANYASDEKATWWEDRQWVAHVKTEKDDFMHTLLDEEWRSRETGHTDVTAKVHMFVNHYSISTGMVSAIVGLGAKYGDAYKDSNGEFLRGDNTYTINMPADPPAGLFWSLTIYDAETAAGVDAPGQTYSSLNSMDGLEENADGSTTIVVGPQRPEGTANWLRTVPGRGFFSLFRFYGPTQRFFDRQYKPGDFVRTS
ncbi:DUF1214 domain-containing protein [Gordonia sp. SID5947]|uniref:DUF1254 domain-containing protein n=1 Tax=Gordonia sp. SID5947 TaxID=2690315 RepID=UPI00136C593D|nr:DUF1254 domain-containing protein [Gordonia sp. SID5947]MYR08133.1 DUF1214 domain-containing protein [Gordonia sp. SID5947]